MGLVPIHVYDVCNVYDGVSWVTVQGYVEKFGHVLNIGESGLFLKDLNSVCRDKHFSFWESCVKSKGFMVQNNGTLDLKCERVPDTVSEA